MIGNTEKSKNIIFDLDGTVIDSYPGIQASFNNAYKQLYNRSCPYNIKSFVGPPINDIFAKLSDEADPDKIAAFVRFFQKSYDAENYKLCTLYEGMEETLKCLKARNINIYIATNKRWVPTELILNELDIAPLFKKIYCIDSTVPKYSDKTEMIAALLKDEKIHDKKTLFVGDTFHDQIAAEQNNIEFIYAGYGFGDLINVKNTITHSLNILNYIN